MGLSYARVLTGGSASNMVRTRRPLGALVHQSSPTCLGEGCPAIDRLAAAADFTRLDRRGRLARFRP